MQLRCIAAAPHVKIQGLPSLSSKFMPCRIAKRFVNGVVSLGHRDCVDGVEQRARCGLPKLQTVIDAACWLRTLMKDARGDLIR